MLRWLGKISLKTLPRALATISVCGCCLCFGAGLSVLGASVAFIALELHLDSSNIGQLFAIRGVGFLFGVYAVSKVLKRGRSLFLSKQAICTMAACFSSLATGSVPTVVSHFGLGGLRFSFLFQGFWFGMVDSLSFIAIAEMWGQKSQKWMQLKTVAYGFGGALAPILVGSLGYRPAFRIISLLCLVSVASMFGQQLALTLKALDEYTHWQSLLWSTVEGLNKRVFHEDFVAPEMLVLEENLEIIEQNARGNPHYDESAATQGLVEEALGLAQLHSAAIDRKWSRTKSMGGIRSGAETGAGSGSSAGSTGTGGGGGARRMSLGYLPANYQGITDDFSAISYMEQPLENLPVVGRRQTLTYSTKEIVDAVESNKWDIDMALVPTALRHALADLSFWHIGILYAFSAWISSYSVMNIGGLTLSEGAYFSALFFSFIFLGALYSIPAALYLSTAFVLRLQVALQLLGSICLFLPIRPLIKVLLATTLNGFAVSCVIPMAMTVANDYGMTMDAETTVAVVVGGCFGEAMLPIIVGGTIYLFGPQGFAFSIMAMSSIVCVSYALVEWRLQTHVEVVQEQEQRRNSIASVMERRKNSVSDRKKIIDAWNEVYSMLSRGLSEVGAAGTGESPLSHDPGQEGGGYGRGEAGSGTWEGSLLLDGGSTKAQRMERGVSSAGGLAGDEWRLQGKTAQRLRADTLSSTEWLRGEVFGGGEESSGPASVTAPAASRMLGPRSKSANYPCHFER